MYIIIIIIVVIILISVLFGIFMYYKNKNEQEKQRKEKEQKELQLKQKLLEDKRILDFRPPSLAGQTCSSNINNGICTDITGANGYKATLKLDGDLSIYNANKTPSIKWSGNTGGNSDDKSKAIWKVTTDGRIVVINGSNSETWQSNEPNLGIQPYYSAITGCNLQLLDSNDKVIWSDPQGC